MKKLTLALVLFALTGCAMGRTQPLSGIFYTDTKEGELVASGAAGSRVGEACAESYFGLVAMGDASIETARRNGGITTITSVDSSSKSYVVYGKYCTIVRGR